ncbi:hypothetical protein MST22_05340 [Virgibacillus halodenitrificans]|nr:hypothetical protein [Virgibacillus halodenitrificans]
MGCSFDEWYDIIENLRHNIGTGWVCVITMIQMKVGPWVIETDVNLTKNFYNNYHVITKDCSCDYCANYILACANFPPEIKNFFDSLGIDPCKEGEISHYIENKDGTHLYSAFYHMIGRVITKPQVWELPNNEISIFSLAGYEIGFSEDLDLVPEGFPTPTIQVEIEMTIPWLLS